MKIIIAAVNNNELNLVGCRGHLSACDRIGWEGQVKCTGDFSNFGRLTRRVNGGDGRRWSWQYSSGVLPPPRC